MSKSSNSIFPVFALAAFFLLGCNREKRDGDSAEGKIGAAAESAAAESAPIDSAAPKTESSHSSFDKSIEGYKASELGEAIHSGSIERFKDLVGKGAPIDKCLTDETYVYDALYAAIAFDKKDIVEYIIQNKLYSDINKTYSEDAETPLTMACAIQDTADALQVSRLLISKGANVDGAGESGGEETKTPLFTAVGRNNAGLVRLLLEKGAKKDISNSSGATPLSAAEESGFSDIARLLK